MARRDLWKPGVPDAVFGIVLLMGLVGGRSAFLSDPGTFWHIELGRQTLATGEVPRFDTFTYTRANRPWVDQSWLFDIGVAAVYDRWGWSGTVAVTAVVLALVYGWLGRCLVEDGVSPLVAGVLAILAAGVGSIHFLVRPHIFTFAFVLATLRLCRAYHLKGGRAIWCVPPLVAIWANVHGGFLAGPIIVATAIMGHVVSAGPWDLVRKRRLAGFAGGLVLACLAPLANPYGAGLYRHVFGLLVGSGVTKLINEYQSIPFGSHDAMVVEWFILALVGLPCFSRLRLSRYELAHIVVWLHFALSSVRQVPLFAIVAAPGLARLVDGLLSPSTDPARDAKLRRWSLWSVVASVAVAAVVASGVQIGWLDPTRWPTKALPVLNRQPVSARLFHEQDWGGMIEASCVPKRRTYLDDRFELFGKQEILDYLRALEGGPGWDELEKRYQGFDLVWVRTDCGLAKRLATDPQWKVEFRDEVSSLFRRRP